jgi:hypothetical protein
MLRPKFYLNPAFWKSKPRRGVADDVETANGAGRPGVSQRKGRGRLKIIIESEVPNDPTALFMIILEGKLVAEHLTVAQVQLVVGDIMARAVLGKGSAAKPQVGKP